MAPGSSVEHMKLGVAIIDELSDYDMAAVRWACNYLKNVKEYKPCIIRVKLKEKEVTEGTVAGRSIKWGGMQNEFKKDANFEEFEKLTAPFRRDITAEIFEGKDIQTILQQAIDKVDGLDTLVLGWAPAKDKAGSQTMQNLNLQSTECTIVLPKIDPGARRKLSLSAPAEETRGRSAAAPGGPLIGAVATTVTESSTATTESSAATHTPPAIAPPTVSVSRQPKHTRPKPKKGSKKGR